MQLNIKPSDSLDLVWSGSHKERLEYFGCLYKWCISNKHWIPEYLFHNNRSRSDGKEKYCKECYKAYSRNHKFSPEQRKGLLEDQGWVCLICEKDLTILSAIQTPIDVNRATGAIRGVLCRSCNTILGQVDEDVSILRRFVSYIESDGTMT